MPSVIINASTKINLRLKVIGKRKDGYHLLSMLNEKLLLSDRIHIWAEGRLGKYSKKFPIDVKCAECPSLESESNLVVRAARRFAEKHDLSTPLMIRIEKNIPVGAGLGGGSSDAAACLMALNKLWGLYRPREELAELGVTIGADVPFFLYDGPAHITGIGEVVDTEVTLPKLWVLLINPGFEISTKWVYESLDLELTQKGEDDSFPAFFNDLGDLEPFVENDLESVVLKKYPEVGEIKRHLADKGARIVFMSGSGSTVVGIFQSKKERDSALLGPWNPQWKIFPTENLWIGGK